MKNKSPVAKGMFSFFIKIAGMYSRSRELVMGEVATFKKHSRFLDAAVGLLPMLLLYPLYRLGDHLVFSKVKQKLGKNFIAGVSGGGSLSAGVDTSSLQ